MKPSSKLTPESRAKLAGLGIVALLALGIFGAQELSRSAAPEPTLFDFRDAPSSTISIRKPRLGLLRPLGSYDREEVSASAATPLKVRDANPLLAGAGPARGPRGAAFLGGSKVERAGDSAELGAGPARSGGTLQKSSLSGLSGSSGGSGGFGGQGASGRAAAPSFGGTASAPTAAGDGAAAGLGRKARALLGAGVQRVASALGSQALQTFASSLQGQGGGAGSGTSAAGTAAASPSDAAGVSAANAGNVGGGPVNVVDTKLATPAKITDTKEVKRPDDKEDEARKELERLRALLNGSMLNGGLGLDAPDTALGRCIGRAVSLDARCRGYTCAARDADDISGQVQDARDAGFATGASVLKAVNEDLERLRPQVEAFKQELSRKRWSCRNCPALNDAVVEAENKLQLVLAKLDAEKAGLDRAIQGIRGETRAAIGPDGSASKAAADEQAFLSELGLLRTYAPRLGNASQYGVPAEVDLPGTPPTRGPEPAGERARDEFNLLAQRVVTAVAGFEAAVSRSWCSRHGCAVPDTDGARRALREHIDTLDVFEDFLQGGDGRDMREALRHLESARQQLPRGAEGRGAAFFSGLFELYEAEGAAEQGERHWRGAARSACSER